MDNKAQAAAQYNARAEYINAKLIEIQNLLAKHAAQAADHPGDWSYSGSLGHVVEELDAVANFLGA